MSPSEFVQQLVNGVTLGSLYALIALGITLIFATDLHHLVIAGLHDSYRLFQPGEVPAVSDVTTLVTRTIICASRISVTDTLESPTHRTLP